MKAVWLLLLIFYGTREPSAVVIDNIASLEECERVRLVLKESGASGRCVEVFKK